MFTKVVEAYDAWLKFLEIVGLGDFFWPRALYACPGQMIQMFAGIAAFQLSVSGMILKQVAIAFPWLI